MRAWTLIERRDDAYPIETNLNKKMDCFQTCKLIVVNIDTQSEEKSSISPIDQFVGLPFDKVCELRLALRDDFVALLLQNTKIHSYTEAALRALLTSTGCVNTQHCT